MKRLHQRSTDKEMMDDLLCEGEVLSQTLKELKIINKLLGGNKVTTTGLHKLLTRPNITWPVTVADLGCGGGDMIKVMAKWADKKGYPLEFIAVDANPNVIMLAKENLSGQPSNIHFRVGNVFEADFIQNSVDIITCTLFTHHFTDEELHLLFKNFKQKAKLGILINDFHRHPLAYYSIKTLTALFSKSEMVKNDAPISVARSFSKKDWETILLGADIKNFTISWHWAFRWQVICWV
jgi:2-polyprenyl-3-methyl-5-hydroxy-6-metoxy-1,4-benzoquinol methylase